MRVTDNNNGYFGKFTYFLCELDRFCAISRCFMKLIRFYEHTLLSCQYFVKKSLFSQRHGALMPFFSTFS